MRKVHQYLIDDYQKTEIFDVEANY
jgi:hypothetical protein